MEVIICDICTVGGELVYDNSNAIVSLAVTREQTPMHLLTELKITVTGLTSGQQLSSRQVILQIIWSIKLELEVTTLQD